MISIGCHSANPEKNKGLQGADIFICIPQLLRVIFVWFTARWLTFTAARNQSFFFCSDFCIIFSIAASSKLTFVTVVNSPSIMIWLVLLEIAAALSTALARPINAPVSSSCNLAVPAFFRRHLHFLCSRCIPLSVHTDNKTFFIHCRILLYSIIFPSIPMVITCQGMNFPLFWSAFLVAISSPPQHGTSILTIVTLWISLFWIIAVSFSL